MNADDIVRALADADPIYHEGDFHWCALCSARLPIRPEHHEESCVWRLAVEWVEGAGQSGAIFDGVNMPRLSRHPAPTVTYAHPPDGYTAEGRAFWM